MIDLRWDLLRTVKAQGIYSMVEKNTFIFKPAGLGKINIIITTTVIITWISNKFPFQHKLCVDIVLGKISACSPPMTTTAQRPSPEDQYIVMPGGVPPGGRAGNSHIFSPLCCHSLLHHIRRKEAAPAPSHLKVGLRFMLGLSYP